MFFQGFKLVIYSANFNCYENSMVRLKLYLCRKAAELILILWRVWFLLSKFFKLFYFFKSITHSTQFFEFVLLQTQILVSFAQYKNKNKEGGGSFFASVNLISKGERNLRIIIRAISLANRRCNAQALIVNCIVFYRQKIQQFLPVLFA